MAVNYTCIFFHSNYTSTSLRNHAGELVLSTNLIKKKSSNFYFIQQETNFKGKGTEKKILYYNL